MHPTARKQLRSTMALVTRSRFHHFWLRSLQAYGGREKRPDDKVPAAGEAEFEDPTSFCLYSDPVLKREHGEYVGFSRAAEVETPREIRDSAAKRCIGRERAKHSSPMQDAIARVEGLPRPTARMDLTLKEAICNFLVSETRTLPRQLHNFSLTASGETMKTGGHCGRQHGKALCLPTATVAVHYSHRNLRKCWTCGVK